MTGFLVPLVQMRFHFIQYPPLKGDAKPAVDSAFTFDGWFSGAYQITKEQYLNEAFGFRDLFVRLNNQIAFSFFNTAKANGVIVGKKNYLFEINYIKAYYGDDFIGTDSINHRLERLKYIQDTLARLNKNIVLVFAAGKGSFYPEYFPNKYHSVKKITNYEYHLQKVNELGINHIDFNSYFLKNKSTSKYPLYPQYGIHWSKYGMCLVADSLIRYFEHSRSIDMPGIFWKKVDIKEAHDIDYDIAAGMNLLFHLRSFNMAYPEVFFEDKKGKQMPTVLVISDSYYWGLSGYGITNCFRESQFWYYNKQIYPETDHKPLYTSQVVLKDEIAKHDIIVIMATEANLPEMGWNFIEQCNNLFRGINENSGRDKDFQKKVNELKKYIPNDKKWMEQIITKARLNNISIDSMITLDAIWIIEHPDSK
jgi:hypothetical protein